MKKIFLFIFPLAFLIGLMPYFLLDQEVSYTSSHPNISPEEEQVQTFSKEDSKKLEREVKKVEKISADVIGVTENATKLITDGIYSI